MDNKKKKEMEESEEKYRLLAKSSPFGISIISKEGVYEYINPKFTEILGYTLEDISTGKDWFKKAFPDPKYRKKVVALWIGDLKKAGIGESRPRIFTVICRDGSKKEIQFIPVTLSDGKQFVTYEDITEQKKTEEKLSAIYDLSKEMSLSLDLDQISKIVLDAAEKVLNFDNIDLFLIDEEKNELYAKESRGLKEPGGYTIIPLSGEKGITAYVARTGESLNVPDVRKDKRYLFGLKESRSELSVPIKVRDKVIGVIDAESKELNAFSKEDQRLLETLASQTGVAIENARLFRELSSLKEFNETIVSSLNEGIWVEDEKGFCTYANPKLNETLGYDTLIGKHWKEVVAPEEIDHVAKETITRPYGRRSSYETILLMSNGERIPVIVSATPLFEKGKFIGMIGVIVDITDVKKMEESLKESGELYRSLSEFNKKLLENSPVGIMNLNREMKVEYENPEMRRILGLPFGRELSATWKDIREVPFVEETGISSIFDELRKGKEISKEISFTFPEGERGYLTLKGVPIIEDSKFAGAVLLTNDITERKKMEEKLRKSEEKFRMLFKNNPEATAYLTPDGYILDINPRFSELFGYSPDEIKGKHINEVVVPKDKIEEAKRLDRESIKGGYASCVTVRKRRDGSLVPVSISGGAVVVEGSKTGMLAVYKDITEVKRAEEALKESEERLRGIFDASDEIIFTKDVEGYYTHANAAFSRIFKRPLKEIVGKKDKEIFSEKEAKMLREVDLKLLESGGTDTREDILTVGGEVRIFKTTKVPLRNEVGKIVGLCGFAADITERKKAEEKLKESEKRFQDVVLSSADWIWEVDKNGRYTFASGKIKQNLGYDPEEIIGKTPFELMPKEEAERISNIFEKIASKKKPIIDLENWNLTKEGEKICLLTNGVPILNEKGELLGYRGVDKDITERKKTEEALRKSEEKYRDIFENANDVIWTADVRGRYTSINKMFEKTTGYGREELIGTQSLKIVAEEDREKSIQLYQKTLGGEPQSYELKIKMKNGNTKIFILRTRPVQKNGEIVGIQGIARDVTERKKMEEILKESEKKYRTTFEHTGTAMAILEEDATISLVNSRFEELSGYSKEEIEGEMTWTKLVHPDDLKKMIEYHKKRRENPEKVPNQYEFRAINKNGNILNMFLNVDIIPGTKKSIVSLIDITELKKAEEELRKSEERYRLITESTRDIISLATFSLNPIYTYVSPSAKYLGYKPEEVIGKPCFEFIHPDDTKKLLPLLKKYITAKAKKLLVGKESEISETIEHRLIDKSGNWHYFQTIANLIGNQMLFVSRDITERKKMGEELRKSEAQYRSIFNSTTDSFLIFDLDGNIVEANPQACKMYGYSYEELIKLSGKDIVHPDYYHLFEKFKRDIRTTGEFHTESVDIHKDGTPFNIEVRGTKFNYRSKEHLLAVIRDITEHKKAEKALEDNKEKIEQLHKIATQMESAQSEEEIYQLIIDAARRILEFTICSVSIVNGEQLEIKATSYEEIPKDRYMSINEGVMGRTYRTGKSYLIDDVRKDKDAKPTEERFRSALSVPIWNIGVFIGISDKLNAFTQEDLKLAELLISHATEALKRIQSEKTLQEERDKAQKYLDVAGVMIIVVGADQKISLTNKRGYEILECKEKEIIGKNWFDNFVPEKNRKKARETFEKLMRGEVRLIEYGEFSVLTESGKEKIIAWHNTLLKDEQGNIIGVLSSGSDITDRRKAEEALRKSEEDYQTIFENLPFVAFTLDKKGRMLEANKWAEEVTGLQLKDAKGKSFSKLGLLGKKDLLKAFIEFRKNLQGKITEKTIYNIKLKDGREILLELIGIPLKEKGKVTKVLDVGSDVTERKKAEEKIRRLKEFNEGIVQSMAEGIVVENTEGYFTFVNPAAADLLGYSPTELLGQHWTVIVPPDQQPIVQAADERRTHGKTDRYELELVHKNGRRLSVLVSGSPRFEEGRFAGTLAVFTNITERKFLEQQKEKSRREAEFYADVLGHDVGNINQIISGYLYLLQNAKDEETRKKNVRGIKKSIMKSKRLAESIKTLKIIKDTKIEKFDLNKSIERSIKEIKEYSDREIEVNLNIKKEYYVKANDFLDKVFFNIFENAVEYTFHDPVIIDIKTEEKDGFCSVYIHDYGLGISKEKREDILKNLETLSKRTGIGFYLTKKILDRFNGKFEIKDAKKGTEIVVTLQVVR